MKDLKNFILIAMILLNIIALVCFFSHGEAPVFGRGIIVDTTRVESSHIALGNPEVSMEDSCTLNVEDYNEHGDFVPFGEPDTTSANAFYASVGRTDTMIGKIYDEYFRNRNIPLEQKIDSMMRRRELWAEALGAIWAEMGTAAGIQTDIVRYKISKVYHERLANCENDSVRENTWKDIIGYYRFDPYFQEMAGNMMCMAQWSIGSAGMKYLNYAFTEEQIEECWYELITEGHDITKPENDGHYYMSRDDLIRAIPFSHEEMDWMDNREGYLETYDHCRKSIDALDRQLDEWCPPKVCCKRLVRTLKMCLSEI